MTDTSEISIRRPDRRLTRWSWITAVVAFPVWWFVFTGSVMSRAVDGGIFLSVVGGLQKGLPLYSGVWDNKDPLFFLAMLAAASVSDVGPFVMDWMWIPLGSLGGWLIARGITSGDRALFLGLIATPIVLTGPAYAAGWTNTPGTSLALLTLGLIMARLGFVAGITLGILFFAKLVVWPIALLGVAAVLLWPGRRQQAVRALLTSVITLGVIAGGLAIAGWLGSYVDALTRNRDYASDVMVYFGFAPNLTGHLWKLRSDVGAPVWLSLAAIGAILILGAAFWVMHRSEWDEEQQLAVIWLAITTAGVLGVLAMTYVWPHHIQILFLPGALALTVLVAFIPARWPFALVAAVLFAASWLLGGWGTPSNALNRVEQTRDSFAVRWAEINEIPTDARLLSAVPLANFTYARLGTNDDRGYLLSARPDASLKCPQFHLYDFSSDEDFARMLECIQDVDALLVTENFVIFGNGGKAASVQPILQYVAAEFECLRIEERQVCTRS